MKKLGILVMCVAVFLLAGKYDGKPWYVAWAPPGDQLKVDLNGDGVPDDIFADWDETVTFGYKLVINGLTVKGRFEDGDLTDYGVADVDPSDRYKEVFLHTPGPSNDDLYLVFRYDGRHIHQIGKVEGMIRFVRGDKRIYTFDWFDFWDKNDVYVLRNGKIVKVEKKFYWVGEHCTVEQPFELYSSPGGGEPIWTLDKGDHLAIVMWKVEEKKEGEKKGGEGASGGWYFVWDKDAEIAGWCEFKDLFEKVKGLQWAD